MWHNQKTHTLRLQATDINAILCALDLVVNSDSGNSSDNQRNFLNCRAVADKLHSNIHSFTPNELRVIHVGIGFALDLLTDGANPYISMDELEPDWQEDIRRNFFTYNRLYPLLTKLTDQYADKA